MSPDSSKNMAGSIHSIGSQESYAINRSSSQSRDDDKSPPPIPPRAPRRPQSIGLETVNQIDPDYHYIKDEDVVDGRPTTTRVSTQGDSETVDQQLDDLLRDIVQENKIKQRKQMNVISPYAETTRKANTINHQTRVMEDIEKKKSSYFQIYGDKGASDYLDPVPSKNVSNSPSREWARPNGLVSKRHSSGEFNNTLLMSAGEPPAATIHDQSSSSSSHDYHTIPDKPVTPRHGHSSSMDSTYTESSATVSSSDRRSWLRTHSGSDEPPSPPLPPRPSYLTRLPSNTSTSSPKPSSHQPMKGDISPYAITKGMVGVTVDNGSSTNAPPLPPRSPSKHQRERVLSHSHSGSRCQKCNGVKVPSRSSSSVRHYHRLPPSPPPDTTEALQSERSSTVSSLTKPRPKSQPMMGGGDLSSPMYGYGNEIDSALAMLDDCLTGLNIDVDTSSFTTTTTESLDSSAKSTNMIGTDIDKAIKSIQELGTDLSQHSQKPYEVSSTNPLMPPRSQVSLTQKGSVQSTHKSKHDHLSYQYSNSNVWYGNTQNGSTAGRVMGSSGHHPPLGKYHSTNEIPSNAARVHNMQYN